MTKAPREVLATLLLAAAACSTSNRTVAETAPKPATVHGDIANAKPDSSRFPFTEADVHFMSGMIHHHSQAIAMAKMAPTHDAGPSLRILAARIINAQGDEINLMSQWLRDHKQPVPEPNPKGMKMNMGGMEHVMLMPGMLSEEQMNQLDQARGIKFDELFLTFMIQHHQGALAMVKELFATPGAGQDETTFKLASDVQADQETEIERMQKMLFTIKTEGRSP